MKAISTMKTELIPCVLWFLKYSQFFSPFFLSASLSLSLPGLDIFSPILMCPVRISWSSLHTSFLYLMQRVEFLWNNGATREIGTRGLGERRGEYMYLCKSGRGLHSVSSKTSPAQVIPKAECVSKSCLLWSLCMQSLDFDFE